MQNLEILLLNDNKISKIYQDALLNMKNLKELRLTGNRYYVHTVWVFYWHLVFLIIFNIVLLVKYYLYNNFLVVSAS